MPIFRPRTRVEILRDMISRVIARSRLVGLVRNSVVFHVLAASADEDAEQYFQMVNLRRLFSIDTATGSDLDERARDIQPSTITRRTSQFASGDVTFYREGTVGTLSIPAGTIVAASDVEGQVQFRTTVLAQITPGNSSVSGVGVVAVEAGASGNVEDNTIVRMVSRVAGVTRVTNPSGYSNGTDRESDEVFRGRLKRHVQSLSRGTVPAITSFALAVRLSDGRQPLFAKVVEPILPTGAFDVYIDDGTGTIEEYEETYLSADDVFIASAVGGELDAFTTNKPIRDDGSFQLWINSVLQTRNTDYWLNPALGKVAFAVALTTADEVKARYRNYIGLIQEVQRVLDGVLGSVTYPGVRAGGLMALVKPASAISQSLTANVVPLEGYDVLAVIADVETAIRDYINNLDIGAHVIVSEIIERAMGVEGVFNFQIADLSGTSPAADQIVLPYNVARIQDSSLTVT
jgi:uncharacterized phage protein gp47/JayE